MSSLGCPRCGSTPVVWYLSTRKWSCKRCKHEWVEGDKAKASPAKKGVAPAAKITGKAAVVAKKSAKAPARKAAPKGAKKATARKVPSKKGKSKR